MTALPPAAPPAEAEAAVSVILTRAGNAMSATGERLLVDRLHRFLDDSDADALTTLPEALLDHLRTLVALLPGLVQDDADPRMVETAQTLGALLHQQGIPLRDLVAECIDVYERLLHGFVKDLRDSDRALAAAMIQMSGTMLEIGRHALLAYQENATSSLKMLALSDSLTSLANRRSFDGRFQEELARARRLDRTLALILIDIDGLKTVNDTFGHAAGDRLLSIFAAALRSNSRGIDLAARIGGDEFAFLLPETSHAGTLALLQRLQRELEDQLVHGQPVRFSAGVAVYPDDGATVQDLTRHADDNLYRAKRQGRP